MVAAEAREAAPSAGLEVPCARTATDRCDERRRNQDHQLVVGSLRQAETVLYEAERPSLRMVECSDSAGAMQDPLLIPRSGKERTVFAQRIDEAFDPRVAKCMAIICPEFCQQSPGPVLPLRNKGTGGFLQEDEAQQVALMTGVQPAAKEPRGSLIPAACGPETIEAVGRMLDCLDRGQQ